MTQAPKVPFLPREWRYTLAAPLEEDAPADYLANIELYLGADYLLSQKDLQALLYLVLYPPEVAIKPKAHTSETVTHGALALLDRYLLHQSPSRFCDQLPLYPLTPEERDRPKWLQWAPGSQSREQHFHATMRRCLDNGIWGLIWQRSGKADKGKRKRTRMNEADDEDEAAPVVSENGWLLLGWLVRMWKKDREEHKADASGARYSPTLLSQLPGQPGKARRTGCDSVFHILRDAFLSNASRTPLDTLQRQQTATDLLVLIVDFAQTNPPLLPTDLLTSETMPFCAELPADTLTSFLAVLTPRVPWSFIAAVCGLLVEMLAQKSQHFASIRQRQRRAVQDKQDVLEQDKLVQPRTLGFEPPSIEHLLTLLAHPPHLTTGKTDADKAARNNKAAQMATAKLLLLSTTRAHQPSSAQDEWRGALARKGGGWKGTVKESFNAGSGALDGPTQAKVVNAERVVLALLDMDTTGHIRAATKNERASLGLAGMRARDGTAAEDEERDDDM